jgi:hypothetical protein
VIEVSWINKKIPQFFAYLASSKNLSIFDNELIKTILQEQDYTWQMCSYLVVPSVAYMLLLLNYFIYHVTGPRQEKNLFLNPDDPKATVNRVMITLIQIYLLLVECTQVYVQKQEYFSDYWNLSQITLIFLCQFVVIEHSTKSFGVDEDMLIQITTLLTGLLWIAFYYMWRLIPNFAFYVSMLTQTAIDLKIFLFFYVMIIITFATVQMIMYNAVNTSEFYGTEYNYRNVFKSYTDYPLLDSFVSMWSLGLGDFDIELYAYMESDLLFLFFLIASFITNVVFLNMMIAIMGDTFEKMTEKRERNGLRERTLLYADFMHFIIVNKEIDNH